MPQANFTADINLKIESSNRKYNNNETIKQIQRLKFQFNLNAAKSQWRAINWKCEMCGCESEREKENA